MKRIITAMLCLLLLMQGVFAAEPEMVCEIRDGQRYMVQTITMSPDQMFVPDETEFEQEGYRYSFLELTTEENRYYLTKQQEETITLEVDADKLEDVLPLLNTQLTFEQEGYTGNLLLQLDSVAVEAAGYESQAYTISDTKIFSGLSRNDPSLVPTTTVKNGATLTLANITWQSEGAFAVEAAVGSVSYTATAQYSARASRKVATGYLATATYSGEVVSEGTESITYAVTYQGTAILGDNSYYISAVIAAITGLFLLSIAAFLWRRYAPNTKVFSASKEEPIYRLRLSRRCTMIDLTGFKEEPFFFVELNAQAAKLLKYDLIHVRTPNGEEAVHFVEPAKRGSYMFIVDAECEEKEMMERIMEDENETD